jgi:uncharacterized protein with von Willebrand factor type A (vWA) domain
MKNENIHNDSTKTDPTIPKLPTLKTDRGFVYAGLAIDMSGSLSSKGMLAIKATVKALVSDLQSQGTLFEFTLWAFDDRVHFESIKKLNNFDNHVVDENEIDETIDWIFKFGRGGSSLDESFYFIKAFNFDFSNLIFITDGIVQISPDCPTFDDIEKHIFLLADNAEHHTYIQVPFKYKLTEIFL